MKASCWWLLIVLAASISGAASPLLLHGAELSVEIENGGRVTFVGAVNRWDADGNPRSPIDPAAQIESPKVTAAARQATPTRWVFDSLPAGRYDLILLAKERVRLEGFHYPPILEFDRAWIHDGQPPQSAVEHVSKSVAQSRHYENKVATLYITGDVKSVRVLVQFLRDEPTSYDAALGEQAATLRHEVWQFTNRYGGWAKERHTKVLDRVLMPKRELRRWTWVWLPELGGIEVHDTPVHLKFVLPAEFKTESSRGLLPY